MVGQRRRRDEGESGMAVAGLMNRSTPYSGSARGLRRAWQNVRNCEAVSTSPALTLLAAHIPSSRLLMEEATLRDRSTPYSGSARGLRRAWQSVRSCEAVSTNPALRILAAHIRTPRLGMAVAGLRDRSTPYSGSALGLRRAWQSVRSCEAVSTHPAL